jgi:LmbE family N-acetylglucosaminyl deacetylase
MLLSKPIRLWLNRVMRVVYLSPHLDDAVLSAGGLIHRQVTEGASVEIWSFMAGIPETSELGEFAKTMHGIWGLGSPAQAVEARRAEDRRAAKLLGARAVHFDFLDCIYRRSRRGEPLYSEISVPIHAEDADLPAQLAQTMIAWLRPDDTAVCQLSIGEHVDHRIVRKAAEMLNRPLTYDADIPYTLDHPDELAPAIVGMRESFEAIPQPGLDRWIDAIECYASQIDAVFGGQENMRGRMRDYWAARGGISLWAAV